MPPQIEIALLRLWGSCADALIVGEPYTIDLDHVTLTVIAKPKASAPPAPEGACEEDVLACVYSLVACHGRRVTTKEILAELEFTEHIWGRSTVLNALATLVHKGLLMNPRDKKGYGVPCMSPIATNHLP